MSTCIECGKVYVNKYNLYEHLIKHDTTYSCCRCDEVFTKRSDIIRHIKENHNQPLIVTNNDKRQVTILCRHGYDRPSNSTGCKVKITCFKLANFTRVKITGVSLEHNHEISKTAFGTTSLELKLEQKDMLTELSDANCKVSQISRVFQSKFDKQLSSQKIRNLLQKLVPKSSDESELQMFLEGIEEARGDEISKLDVDGNVSVLCISWHTTEIFDFYANYFFEVSFKFLRNLSKSRKFTTTAPVMVEIKNDIMSKFKNMLYAWSEELYNENKIIFLTLVNDIQDSCKIMWVKCFKKNLPTLGDNTNNRIERSFWTLKQSLHTRFSSLPEISQSIVYLVSLCSERLTESPSAANLKSLKIHDKDTGICNLNAEASLALNDHVCVLFHKSLKALQVRRELMKLKCEGVRERYEEDEVVYKCSTTECTFTFYANNQSPCRHILLIREQKCGLLSAIFELSLFHSRYHQQRNVELNSTAMHKLDEIEDQVQLDEIEDRIRLDEVEVPVLSNRQKYNMMLPVTLSIASLSACHETDQFQTYLKGMKEVERIIRSDSAIENCSLLAASTCASIQTKPNSTQIIEPELPVPQPLNDENNNEGTSTTLEDKSKPANLALYCILY
ncbi:hypothetical protein AGLY_003801 [Aphis glycines]|uniref:C2H2-type domain-containing protein n=1 Tax=Aphis glycines TaxID=307491 RepID=A0A6G0U1K6_APHGL|nr:hypothetical protein AGLY_003801 [Aphis glycines]